MSDRDKFIGETISKFPRAFRICVRLVTGHDRVSLVCPSRSHSPRFSTRCEACQQ
jgi:hypothetical protein